MPTQLRITNGGGNETTKIVLNGLDVASCFCRATLDLTAGKGNTAVLEIAPGFYLDFDVDMSKLVVEVQDGSQFEFTGLREVN